MKLTIITINLNNAAGLQKTVESVVKQTFTDYEYIVIDGGSTDGSAEIIKQYANNITYWVSEPDKGIYNAMNKGIAKAKGEYCLFLNSGDWLIDNNGLQNVFDRQPTEDIVSCSVQTKTRVWHNPEKLTLFLFFKSSIPHQSTFIKTALFSTVGYYNENNKIVSDWEFFIHAIIKHQCSYQIIAFILTYFDSDGISSDLAFKELKYNERKKVLKENFPMVYDDYQYFILLSKEIIDARNSRVIQTIKKIQQSSFYRKIRGIKRLI